MVSLGCILQACGLGVLMLMGSSVAPKYGFSAWIGVAGGCIAWVLAMCTCIGGSEIADRWRKRRIEVELGDPMLRALSLQCGPSGGNCPHMELVWIPSGTFTMGSTEKPNEDIGCFQCTITQGFWIGRYPVTQAQWEGVMKTNPSEFRTDGSSRPVENVSWFDAMAFCDALARVASGDIPAGFRPTLPTQAQWEFACRAGTDTHFYNGNDRTKIGEIAWFGGNSNGMTHPVGQKKPNGLELYDMLGNVMEWCRDFPDDYPSSPKSDWTGVHNREFRVVKGSSWKTVSLSGLWGASYAAIPPESTRPWFGFRVCVCR